MFESLVNTMNIQEIREPSPSPISLTFETWVLFNLTACLKLKLWYTFRAYINSKRLLITLIRVIYFQIQ